MHRSVLPSSVIGSAALGPMLVMVLWPRLPWPGLLGWWAVLGLAPMLRVLAGAAQGRDTAAAARPALWLRIRRAALLLHGLVWASSGLWLVAGPAQPHFDMVLFALAGVVAGGLMGLGFDLLAAMLFAAAPAPLMMAGIVWRGSSVGPGLGLMALMLLAFGAVGALRAQC